MHGFNDMWLAIPKKIANKLKMTGYFAHKQDIQKNSLFCVEIMLLGTQLVLEFFVCSRNPKQ